MSVFPHRELRYYGFGLRAGAANLVTNGWRLGTKKTIGKITQPINAPSRFAEYDAFDTAIRRHLAASPAARPRILDVGSPKLFGLRLAYTCAVDLLLTDISELNLDEYRVMWRGLEKRAKGTVEFARKDARALELPSDSFDEVYSMSVIEHIDGDGGDSQAVQELLRVLKPGGLVVLSVPFGRTYREQNRIGFAGAVRSTGDQRSYFFQRIYDRRAFDVRILAPARGLESIALQTVTRQRVWLGRLFGRAGDNVRGALGFLNPFLSAAISRTKPGLDDDFPVSYGDLHEATDTYGDVILCGVKRAG